MKSKQTRIPKKPSASVGCAYPSELSGLVVLLLSKTRNKHWRDFTDVEMVQLMSLRRSLHELFEDQLG